MKSVRSQQHKEAPVADPFFGFYISKGHKRVPPADHPELAFFINLSGTLRIDLVVPDEPGPYYENDLKVRSDARIVNVRLEDCVYEDGTRKHRRLTLEEYSRVAFRGESIRLKSQSGEVVSHRALNGSYFTVYELLCAVEETERRTRANSEWLGGIDIRHIYFEGLEQGDDDVWETRWGS
jgi:hypothetical protein